jgi:superfamily II DNA or RNA helicase
VPFTFNGELRDYQQDALREILTRDFGTVSIPTGGGKTILALAAIAERKQPALIVVHTKELLNQWTERIETFLGIPRGEVGVIGVGKVNVGEKITVALVQSLYKCSGEVSKNIGFLVVDECHRAPARIFTEAVTAFDCRYMLGLSATPFRRDGLGRLIYWYIGDRVYSIDREELIDSHDILPAEVITRQTAFQPTVDPSEHYSAMLSELTEDYRRNWLIISDVAKEARNGGGVCLVLSDRKTHCETLKGILRVKGIKAALLTGDLNDRERRQVVSDIQGGNVKVIVATAQLIGEGFDAKELSTLFLATPIKFSGRLIQCLGRVLRPAPGKDKAIVYDYVDPVGVLQSAARSRAWVYRQVA